MVRCIDPVTLSDKISKMLGVPMQLKVSMLCVFKMVCSQRGT